MTLSYMCHVEGALFDNEICVNLLACYGTMRVSCYKCVV